MDGDDRTNDLSDTTAGGSQDGNGLGLLPPSDHGRLTGSHDASREASAPPRNRGSLQMMAPATREKWKKVIKIIDAEKRIRRIRDAFYNIHGIPCTTCASMRLSEDKFLINEYPKHTRPPRPEESIFELQGLDFGPNKLQLGTLKEIYSRHGSCPFCRLVVNSLKEICDSYLPNHRAGEYGEVVGEAIQEETRRFYDRDDVVCTASWQIDGRLLKRDDKENIKGSRACTRRIRLQWSNKTFPDIYVVLVTPRREARGLFLGRSIDSIRTDPALIRQWIELCHKHHGSICQSAGDSPHLSESFFGVVDVLEMCLTGLPRGGRYVALSYTWGKDHWFFTTKKDNIKSLLEPGSLRRSESNLPRSIRESIDLVQALGERYLWVDALCIIQDSKRSWALNSRVMDLVYGNAYLTICAADGEDANAGLKGLKGGSTFQNIIRYNQEMRLMTTQPAENYIRNSTWNKRGWTFQERLLSSRNLIFTSGRVFFQCRCTARSVDIITEDPSAGWSLEFSESPLLLLQQLHSQPLLVYKKALELYMTRELSFPKDILAAFSGIGNVVCEALGGSLVFGLPSSHFDWALLWEAQDAAVRRPDEEDENFPSWSWCGWKGQMTEYKKTMLAGCEDNLHEWLMKHTWITWYIRDGDGSLRLVWEGACQKAQSSKTSSIWRGYAGPDTCGDGALDKYGRCIKEEERRLPRDEFTLVLDECPYGVSVIPQGVTKPDARNSAGKDMTYLQFYTWSAYFRIREDRRFAQEFGRNFRRYSIEDYKDDWCGTILLDQFWVKGRILEIPLEFIAISDAKAFAPDEYNDWANYIPMECHHSAWDLYYVLLIETDPKSGISSRVGLGKVFKDAFDNSCKPEKHWKEFILG